MKKNEILAICAKQTGFQLERIEETPMNKITRPHLITIVEGLEDKTGKTLCREDMSQPLGWLDGDMVTFGDIADFFANIRKKIHAVIFGVSYQDLLSFRDLVVEKFKEYVVGSETLKEDSVLAELQYDTVPSIEDAIYLVESDLGVVLPGTIPLEETTTLEEMINWFVDARFAKK